MSDVSYQAAIDAAKQFVEAAEKAKEVRYQFDYNGRTIEHMQTGTKECGAAKRSSMELTRQLARFRKGEV